MQPANHVPDAGITIDPSMVRALLQEQHPDLAHLDVIEFSEGCDNKLFRLGDTLLVRVPRRAVAAPLIEHEQRWLPRLSRRLPLPVPSPRRIGRPGCGLPWPWSVTSWLPGEPALHVMPHDLPATAFALGDFLRALHQPAPDDAPRNPWRGIPLADRTPILREHLRQLDGLVDERAVLDLWDRALSTPPWPGPAVWIHGDLHPGNLLVSEGRLSAVIDFGDLTAGDPATDLSVMWMLPPAAQSAFPASRRENDEWFDERTSMRARGWALALGVSYVANFSHYPSMRALGLATIAAALSEAH